jgi:hypothetical protein
LKEKVITIKPFLNIQLAGIRNSDGTTSSPLYYQITYQRKNTQLKSIYNLYLSKLSLLPKEDEIKLRFEMDTLKKLVRHESAKSGIDFNLTGLKNKYEIYVRPVDFILQEHLKKKLLRTITFTGSEYQSVLKFDGFDANFLLLLKASKQLIDNMGKHINSDFKEEIDAYKAFVKSSQSKSQRSEFLCLMDWIDGSFKMDLNRSLIEYFEENKNEAAKTVAILNGIIEDRIKFL